MAFFIKNIKEEEKFSRLGFYSLLATQFQGAFSDNVYKLIIILSVPLFLTQDSPWHRFVTPVCTALFNLPWLLFPALAGSLSDRYSKQRVTVWTKVWELGVMLMGAFAVFLRSYHLLFFTLFLMAMQSTFFSPAKYGILPEILPETRLSWGNGLLNLWTFLAIIFGNAVGGWMIEIFRNNLYLAMFSMVGLSSMGLLTSLLVTHVSPVEPTRKIEINPFAGLTGYFKIFFRDKQLLLAMLGITYFWFAGALIMQNIVEYGKVELDNSGAIGTLLALIAIGIALGSTAAGYFSREKIEMGLVVIGGIMMVILCFFLSIPGISLVKLIVLMFALGFGAGLFDVPLACLLQRQSPNQVRGAMIATSNLVTFGGMTISAGLFMILFSILNCPPRFIFFISGILSLLILTIMIRIEKNMILRALLWILDSTLYRVFVSNRNKLPEKGGALIVSNHVSFVDMLVLFYSFDRKIVFVAGENILKIRWMRWCSKFLNLILVPNNATIKEIEEIIVKIRQQFVLGNWVCVPWEKNFYPSGPEMPWYKDYKVLTKNLDIPIIPIFMDRITEIVYRVRNGNIKWMFPERWRCPIYIEIGDPMTDPNNNYEVRERIQWLGSQCYRRRPYMYRSSLHRAFIHYAKRNPLHFCMADALTGHISYFKAYMGALILGKKFKKILGNEKMVGILVPPTIGGAIVNIALQIIGKVPVNLNYTQSSEIIASCVKTCGIKHVLTSKRFLERVNIDVPEIPVYLEDVRETVNTWDKIWGILCAIFLPIYLIERYFNAPPHKEEDLATIIFSSGSEGNPKGIMLTKRNIMSQAECIRRVIWHDKNTCVLGFLPFFHSFGFTVTIWLPLTNGVRCVFHPNPLEPKVIGGLSQKYKANILLATSTFLQGFIRKCSPEEFNTLEIVMAGAEKLPDRIRKGFYEKFNIEPLEGYGATECSPLVSVNLPDFETPGFFNKFNKVGSIGRPLPGISVRVTDPDTGTILSMGEEGMLEVTGPNIMAGYLNLPEKTEKALRGEWYRTGDIAKIDEDGFIYITDRLARFSKIAGEMISHTRIEEVLHDLLGLTELSLAVTGIPDEQKGERIVVLHTLEEEQINKLIEMIDKSELPNLWKPRPNAFYKVECIPVLGTGKLDIRAIKKLALEIDKKGL